MRHVLWFGFWVVGVGSVAALGDVGNYASQVVDYQPALLATTTLTNPAVVLGEPSRLTEDPDPVWGGLWPVNPFGGPYLGYQILQLGRGASLTVEMADPVLDDPDHAYGIDFLVYGNAFFLLNGDGTTTSGSLGGTNEGLTKVAVSMDGTTFYALDMGLAPSIDTWFPTDGEGDFGIPVDPALGVEDFAGQDLAGLRLLYGGSGGGTGYDLAWAVDEQGERVWLPWIRFIRFEQIEGRAQLDAVSGVAPRRTLYEDFGGLPSDRGWRTHGDGALFAWDAEAEQLEVRWDSSRPNSYFYRSLGTVLSRVDDFLVSIDLRLSGITPGTTDGKPGAFQIAFGLVELETAVRPGFWRGTGVDGEAGARNVLEFDYFPDAGFGATLSPVIVSGDNQFAAAFEFPVELPLEEWVTVVLDYSARESVLRSAILSGGEVFSSIDPVVLPSEFTDFRFDTVAICSYSDEGQSPEFPGSVVAQGAVDNVLVVMPDLPVGTLHGVWREGSWTIDLATQPGWRYALERSVDFQAWFTVDTRDGDDGGRLSLADPSPLGNRGFYRVQAIKP